MKPLCFSGRHSLASNSYNKNTNISTYSESYHSHKECSKECRRHFFDAIIYHHEMDRKPAFCLQKYLQHLTLTLEDCSHKPKIELVENIKISPYFEALKECCEITKIVFVLITNQSKENSQLREGIQAMWSLVPKTDALEIVPLLHGFEETETPDLHIIDHANFIRFEENDEYFNDRMQKCLSKNLSFRLHFDALRRCCAQNSHLQTNPSQIIANNSTTNLSPLNQYSSLNGYSHYEVMRSFPHTDSRPKYNSGGTIAGESTAESETTRINASSEYGTQADATCGLKSHEETETGVNDSIPTSDFGNQERTSNSFHRATLTRQTETNEEGKCVQEPPDVKSTEDISQEKKDAASSSVYSQKHVSRLPSKVDEDNVEQPKVKARHSSGAEDTLLKEVPVHSSQQNSKQLVSVASIPDSSKPILNYSDRHVALNTRDNTPYLLTPESPGDEHSNHAPEIPLSTEQTRDDEKLEKQVSNGCCYDEQNSADRISFSSEVSQDAIAFGKQEETPLAPLTNYEPLNTSRNQVGRPKELEECFPVLSSYDSKESVHNKSVSDSTVVFRDKDKNCQRMNTYSVHPLVHDHNEIPQLAKDYLDLRLHLSSEVVSDALLAETSAPDDEKHPFFKNPPFTKTSGQLLSEDSTSLKLDLFHPKSSGNNSHFLNAEDPAIKQLKHSFTDLLPEESSQTHSKFAEMQRLSSECEKPTQTWIKTRFFESSDPLQSSESLPYPSVGVSSKVTFSQDDFHDLHNRPDSNEPGCFDSAHNHLWTKDNIKCQESQEENGLKTNRDSVSHEQTAITLMKPERTRQQSPTTLMEDVCCMTCCENQGVGVVGNCASSYTDTLRAHKTQKSEQVVTIHINKVRELFISSNEHQELQEKEYTSQALIRREGNTSSGSSM